MKEITVEPPQNESRRDRIERNVFAQLAQMRVADRADAAVPAPPSSNRRAWMFAGLGAAVAAAVILVVTTKSDAPVAAPIAEDTTPSRIVTPVGGESQFTVGDAVIVAASDTSVDVKRAPDGGITLVVARGAVDCDVAPRNQRPPFHVIAGDVSVEVVGTRFSVARTPSPRVDVVRGKVRVRAPGGTWLLAAGDSWTPPVSGSGGEQVAEQAPPQAPDPDIEIDRTPNRNSPTPTPTQVSPHAQYQLAQKLEATDVARAARMYRAIASSKDAWAAPALFGLAELEAKTNAAQALHDCNEYLRRFADSAQAEDVAWLRVEILRSAGRRDEARVAVTEYLRQWPQGSYAGIARRIASPP
ncbi:MAG TPA: FecR family protein [Kofleriaceae bacterium]